MFGHKKVLHVISRVFRKCSSTTSKILELLSFSNRDEQEPHLSRSTDVALPAGLPEAPCTICHLDTSPPISSSNPDPSSPSSTPKTFTHFPLLPPELRHQIWSHSIFAPKIIHVHSTSSPSPSPNRDPGSLATATSNCYSPAFTYTSPSSALALLAFAINAETRSIALRRFIFYSASVRLALDPRVDLLYFGKEAESGSLRDFMLFALLKDIEKVKRLVVDDVLLNELALPVSKPSGRDGETAQRDEDTRLVARNVWRRGSWSFFEITKQRKGAVQDMKSTFFEGFKGLEELIVVPFASKEYERRLMGGSNVAFHCATCQPFRRSVGDVMGWRFPLGRGKERDMFRFDGQVVDYAHVLGLTPYYPCLWGWLWDYMHGTDVVGELRREEPCPYC